MKNEKKKCNSKCADIKSNQLNDSNLENVCGGLKLFPYNRLQRKGEALQEGNKFFTKDRCGMLVSFDNLEEAQNFGWNEKCIADYYSRGQ